MLPTECSQVFLKAHSLFSCLMISKYVERTLMTQVSHTLDEIRFLILNGFLKKI